MTELEAAAQAPAESVGTDGAQADGGRSLRDEPIPIPIAVLDYVHRRFLRMCAAQFLQAMAETDVSLQDMDDRLTQRRGTAQRTLLSYINGTSKDARAVTDLATALGREATPHLRLLPLAKADPTLTAEHDNAAQARAAADAHE